MPTPLRHQLSRIAVLLLVLACLPSGLAEAGSTPETEKVFEVVYIGASNCGPCRSPEMKQAIATAVTDLRARATAAREDFKLIGVATDTDVRSGLKFLEPFGPFDQLLIGGGWCNVGFGQYVARFPNVIYGIPQIVVLETTYDISNGEVRARGSEVLARRVGTQIPKWVESGAVLDRAPSGRDHSRTE